MCMVWVYQLALSKATLMLAGALPFKCDGIKNP